MSKTHYPDGCLIWFPLAYCKEHGTLGRSSPSVAKGEPTTIADAINLYGTKPAAQPGTMTAREFYERTKKGDWEVYRWDYDSAVFRFADAFAAERCRGLEQRIQNEQTEKSVAIERALKAEAENRHLIEKVATLERERDEARAERDRQYEETVEQISKVGKLYETMRVLGITWKEETLCEFRNHRAETAESRLRERKEQIKTAIKRLESFPPLIDAVKPLEAFDIVRVALAALRKE